jgi:hypothetical protein
VTFALPPITNAGDAPEIISAIAAAVTSGDITPSEASEIPKLIDTYVKAFQTADLEGRLARVEQLTDAELLRIAMGGHTAPTPGIDQQQPLIGFILTSFAWKALETCGWNSPALQNLTLSPPVRSPSFRNFLSILSCSAGSRPRASCRMGTSDRQSAV